VQQARSLQQNLELDLHKKNKSLMQDEAHRLEQEIAALKAQIAAQTSRAPEEKGNPYLLADEQLLDEEKRSRKKTHALQFVEEGEWVRKANKLRMNQIAASIVCGFFYVVGV
jgi:hypothetical protein